MDSENFLLDWLNFYIIEGEKVVDLKSITNSKKFQEAFSTLVRPEFLLLDNRTNRFYFYSITSSISYKQGKNEIPLMFIRENPTDSLIMKALAGLYLVSGDASIENAKNEGFWAALEYNCKNFNIKSNEFVENSREKYLEMLNQYVYDSSVQNQGKENEKHEKLKRKVTEQTASINKLKKKMHKYLIADENTKKEKSLVTIHDESEDIINERISRTKIEIESLTTQVGEIESEIRRISAGPNYPTILSMWKGDLNSMMNIINEEIVRLEQHYDFGTNVLSTIKDLTMDKIHA